MLNLQELPSEVRDTCQLEKLEMRWINLTEVKLLRTESAPPDDFIHQLINKQSSLLPLRSHLLHVALVPALLVNLFLIICSIVFHLIQMFFFLIMLLAP